MTDYNRSQPGAVRDSAGNLVNSPASSEPVSRDQFGNLSTYRSNANNPASPAFHGPVAAGDASGNFVNPSYQGRDAAGNLTYPAGNPSVLSSQASAQDIASRILALDVLVTTFQNSPGDLHSPDQNQIDAIEAAVKGLVTIATQPQDSSGQVRYDANRDPVTDTSYQSDLRDPNDPRGNRNQSTDAGYPGNVRNPSDPTDLRNSPVR